MEALREPGDRYIRQVGGFLVVEAGQSTVAELESAYRSFAIVCIKQQVAKVLLKVGDGNPADERTLRDAVKTMLLAGIPPGFKMALLAATPQARTRFRNVQRDLTMAGVQAQLFDAEEEAASWLSEPARGERAAP